MGPHMRLSAIPSNAARSVARVLGLPGDAVETFREDPPEEIDTSPELEEARQRADEEESAQQETIDPPSDPLQDMRVLAEEVSDEAAVLMFELIPIDDEDRQPQEKTIGDHEPEAEVVGGLTSATGSAAGSATVEAITSVASRGGSVASGGSVVIRGGPGELEDDAGEHGQDRVTE